MKHPKNQVRSSGAEAQAEYTSPRGWHSRGYLPHCDAADVCQAVTYRLGDSLPTEVARRLAAEPATAAGDTAYRSRIEAYLDAGHGACWLRRPEIAQLVIRAWRHFDGVRYDLQAWVVMPNHVHVLLRMRSHSLSTIVRGWKSVTAREINRALGRRGRVWHEDYWDRFVRDEQHHAAVMAYIRENPVKAGLVQCYEDWPYYSGPRASPPA